MVDAEQLGQLVLDLQKLQLTIGELAPHHSDWLRLEPALRDDVDLLRSIADTAADVEAGIDAILEEER